MKWTLDLHHTYLCCCLNAAWETTLRKCTATEHMFSRNNKSVYGLIPSCILSLLVLVFASAATQAAPFPAQYELRLMAPAEGRLLGGSEQLSEFGNHVTGLGDINGDGLADYAIGGYSSGETFQGYHVIFYGSATSDSMDFDLEVLAQQGAIFLKDTSRPNPVGDINADGFDDWLYRSGSSDYFLVAGQAEPYANPLEIVDRVSSRIVPIVNSVETNEYPEWRVTKAGDVDGDGVDDLIIDEKGSLWLVPGIQGEGLFEAQTVDLANFTRHQLPGAYYNISSGQDINADGFTDVVIGMDEAEAYEGQVVVLFGGQAEWPFLLQRTTPDGQNGLVIESGSATHSFRLGQSALLAPDLNGDAVADIVLGGYETLYIVYGNDRSWPGFIDLDEQNVDQGYAMDISGYSANSFTVLGDINDDGLADLSIGNRDGLQVLYGSDTRWDNPVLASILSTDGFFLRKTILSDDFREIANAPGDINGDGIDDLLIGDAYGHSNFQYTPGMSFDDVEMLADRVGMAYLVFGRSSDGSPASPAELRAALGPGFIDLRWQAPQESIDGFILLRNGEVLATLDAGSRSYIDETVSSDTFYRYEIIAERDGFESSPLGLDVDNKAARYPAIGGAVYSDSLAEIFWTYENVEYTIYRDNVPVDTRWAASYLDSSYLSTGHTYHVTVVSADSSPVTVRSRTLHLPEEAGLLPPSKPLSPEFSVYSDTTVEIFWTRSASGQKPLLYNVFRDGDSIGITDGNSILDTGLTGDEFSVNYEVVAEDSSGNQSEPARLVANIDAAQQARKPSEAVNISVDFVSSTSLRLAWLLDEIGMQPGSFEIYRDDSLVALVTEPFYLDESVAENRLYQYKIVSVDSSGTRSDASSRYVSTPGGPFAPDSVSAAVYGPQLLEVFWSRATGAERVWSYDVYRNGEFLLNTRQLSFLDTGVTAGSTYSYKLVSVGTDSRSEPSDEAVVTVQDESYWTTQ